METLSRKSRLMLVSDLDWTMVDHDDATHKKLLRLNRLWLTEFAADSLLVFSTGRSPQLFHQLAADVPLLKPDILVCSVGTEILLEGQADAEWEEHLNQGWDREAAVQAAAAIPELELQEASEQRPHKISFRLRVEDPEAVLTRLRTALAEEGLEANVIFSGGVDVDILPSRASKGKALTFLLQQFEKHAGGRPEVLVAGDSGNDIELFAVPGVHSCMVANAHAELRQWCEENMHSQLFRATENGAGGIYQALHQFEFVSLADEPPAGLLRRAAVSGLARWMEDWMNGCMARDADDGLTTLEDALDPSFDFVRPSGTGILSRDAYVHWFAEEAYDSARMAYTEPRGLTSPRPLSASGASPDSCSDAGDTSAPSAAAGPPCLRMWADRYCERPIGSPSEGLWLVRYLLVQQTFIPGQHTGQSRRGRWCSTLLRQDRRRVVQLLSLHETWTPPEEARA